jgi:nitrogen regulatory protein P-II 2
MTTHQFELVTIVCESVLETSVVDLTRSLGASGFTVADVRGEGSGEKRAGEVPENKIKVEIVAESTLTKKIMAEVAKIYFPNYSIIIYSSAINVIRQDKF